MGSCAEDTAQFYMGLSLLSKDQGMKLVYLIACKYQLYQKSENYVNVTSGNEQAIRSDHLNIL